MISIIKNFRASAPEKVLSRAIALNRRGCKIVIFTGDLFQFPDSISLKLISAVQDALELLSRNSRVLVFASICIFRPTSNLLFVDGPIFEGFELRDGEIWHLAACLKTGIHNIATGEFFELPEPQNTKIIVKNNDLSSLPEVADHAEVFYSNCSKITLDYINMKYSNIKFINMDFLIAANSSWKILRLKCKNIFCYKNLEIDFGNIPNLFYISGGNGSGKSSIISIILLGVFGIRPKLPVVKKLCKSAEIWISYEKDGEERSIYTKIVGNEIIADSPFVDFYDNFYCNGILNPKLFPSDLEKCNMFLNEFCDFTIIKNGKTYCINGKDKVNIGSASSGQKFLIDLSIKLASEDPRPQIMIIDECLDKLDANLLERCFQGLRKQNIKFIIIGHRPEFQFMESATIQSNISGSELYI